MFPRGQGFRGGTGHAGARGGSGPWWPTAAGGPGPWWPTGGPGPWWPTGGGPWDFGTDSDPRQEYHENLLVVRLRPTAATSMTITALANRSAVRSTSEDPGLGMLELLERAGRIRRVRPISPQVGREVREASAEASLVGRTRAMHVLAATATHRANDADEDDPQAGVSIIELERDVNVAAVHDSMAADPHVEFVDRVPVRYIQAQTARRPRAAGRTTIAKAAPPAAALWNLQKIRWAEARAKPAFKDAGPIKVAVLDTGVDDNHPDLKGRINGYVYQHPDIPDASGRDDIVGHGTHVSGTIGAKINANVGVSGICAPQLFVWKIFTDQTTYDPGSGIFTYFVDPVMYHRALNDARVQKMQVMNLSIGGPGKPDAHEAELFSNLIKAGVIVCAAMGNEREQGSPISYPAAIPGVIAVGATAIDDTVASFSNRGNHICLCAPGVGIWSTLPTYRGQDGFYAVSSPDGPVEGKPLKRETNYDAWDGTSMATPHVTAAIALLLANKGAQTPTQARTALQRSVDPVPEMGGQSFTPDYGYGRLNLERLV